jgi:hypothetical protein
MDNVFTDRLVSIESCSRLSMLFFVPIVEALQRRRATSERTRAKALRFTRFSFSLDPLGFKLFIYLKSENSRVSVEDCQHRLLSLVNCQKGRQSVQRI